MYKIMENPKNGDFFVEGFSDYPIYYKCPKIFSEFYDGLYLSSFPVQKFVDFVREVWSVYPDEIFYGGPSEREKFQKELGDLSSRLIDRYYRLKEKIEKEGRSSLSQVDLEFYDKDPDHILTTELTDPIVGWLISNEEKFRNLSEGWFEFQNPEFDELTPYHFEEYFSMSH